MIKLLLILSLYLFVFAAPTQAYLDPGTGSYITQLLIGFIAGGSYLLKVYGKQLWQKGKKLFKNTKNDDQEEDSK